MRDCKSKQIKAGILFVILPLLIGGSLYYLLCPNVLFVKRLDALFCINRSADTGHKSFLIFFLRNYFFDLLWAFALTNALSLIFNNNARLLLTSVLLSILLGSLMEVLQFVGLTAGTADFYDIAAEAAGAIVGALIIKNFWRR